MTRINSIDGEQQESAAEISNSCNTGQQNNSSHRSSSDQTNLVSANINLFVQLYEQRNSRENPGEVSFGGVAVAGRDNSLLSEDEENYVTDSSCQTTSNKRLSQKTDVASRDFDLRPKFAILRHRPQLTQRKDASSDARQQTAVTPAWFFNIPTTRSPFPEFGSKLPDDDIDVCH